MIQGDWGAVSNPHLKEAEEEDTIWLYMWAYMVDSPYDGTVMPSFDVALLTGYSRVRFNVAAGVLFVVVVKRIFSQNH